MTLITLKWLDRSATPAARRPLRQLARDSQAVIERVLASVLSPAAPASETAADLFDKAAAYEATQPGYAADLRAAGRLAQAAEQRGS